MPIFPVIFPIRLWPRSGLLVLVLTALLVTLAVCFWWLNAAQHQLQTSQAALAKTTAELGTLRAANTVGATSATFAAASTSQLPPLPSASSIDNVVRDMTMLAKQHQVSIVSLAIESSAKSPQAVAQQHIAVQAKGDYANLKRWTGEMLARHPWLAVKNLNWRSTDQSSASAMGTMATAAPLDATFTWVLYVQD